ncbi:MAG: adenosylcobinamide-phosphate synthase CbiB [Dissulfurispiraceae bacterium]|jgi:adenosylcobinamide-phosphate synthase
MTDILILIAAFCVDLAVGDPRGLPHPVKFIGKGISVMEHFIRRFAKTKERAKVGGVILAFSIITVVFLLTLALNKLILKGLMAGHFFAVVGIIAAVALTETTIAVKDLLDSAKNVISAVKAGTTDEARQNLSMIVGRDTALLTDKGILKATIETLAENLSDGIVAPLFYFAVGGLPVAMTYKAVNTLDSMVGYKNKQYIDLGWASARLDDIANFLPARIAGGLIVLSVWVYRLSSRTRRSLATASGAFAVMLQDGQNHESPNSGIPEAAMAGGLGVMLGGPSTYGGILVEKPYIGKEVNTDYLVAAEHTLVIILIASFLGLMVSIAMTFIRSQIW